MMPAPSENSNLASSRQLVLMDQSAQAVAPTYWSCMAPEMSVPTARSEYHLQGNSSFRLRNLVRQALVRAMPVAVTGVVAQDAPEVGFVHDQQVVQALRSHGANEPFDACVRRMSRPAWNLGDGPEQLSYAATSSLGV
jgi:hypothetical protein